MSNFFNKKAKKYLREVAGKRYSITTELKIAIAHQIYEDGDISLQQFEEIKKIIEEDSNADIIYRPNK